MYECKECGYKTESVSANGCCPICNKKMEETAVSEQPKKKKGELFKRILSTVLIIAVARFAGEYAGKMLFEKNNEQKTNKAMDEFCQQVQEYNPGKMTADGYESEYWNLRLEMNENWEKMNPDELTELEEDAMASAEASAKEALNKENVKGEMTEKYLETIYGKVEAGYEYYTEYYDMAGVLYMLVYSAYGIDEMTEEQAEKELAKEFEALLEDSVTGTVRLGEEEYRYVDGRLSGQELSDVNMRIYIRTEGIMVSMIQLLYVEGHEDIVVNFENTASGY